RPPRERELPRRLELETGDVLFRVDRLDFDTRVGLAAFGVGGGPSSRAGRHLRRTRERSSHVLIAAPQAAPPSVVALGKDGMRWLSRCGCAPGCGSGPATRSAN